MTSQWFGDYEIVKQLRVGGMATLYLARCHGAAGFSRLVALKMIHPHLVARPGLIEMFVDEARICSHISHPNVVHVEGFGVLDGVHYLVMEYLDGCSASELLQVLRRDGRVLDPELAARVVLQIASGLHAAHETRGPDGQPLELIHRDISPSNVLLSVDGHVKLIDFGIARARNRVSETQAGITLKGKYRYVAPEQAQHAAVDRRCDLFSLGVVFWELLTGRPLFTDDHLGLLNRLYQTDAPPPSTVNAAVPAVLDPIVAAMLQHDPADRPQTAAEVQRRIAAAIPGAANREASELGALAALVRDRCAERRARRANGGSAGSNSQSFSASPSPKPRTSSVYRVEADAIAGAMHEATPGETPGITSDATHGSTREAPRSSQVLDAPPPLPPSWWRRRSVQVGVGLVGAGMILGILLGRRGGADARPSAAPGRSRELELMEPRDPTGEARPVPVAASPPVAVQQPVPVAPPPPAAAPPPVPVAPPPPAVAPPPPAVAPPPPRRDIARVAPRPKPKSPRPIADDTPAPRAPGNRPPFTTESFDDAANTSGAPAPAETAKSKAPIVPDFDH